MIHLHIVLVSQISHSIIQFVFGMAPKKRPASASDGTTLALPPSASPKAKAETSNEAIDSDENNDKDNLFAGPGDEETKPDDNTEEQEEEPEDSAHNAKPKAKKAKKTEKQVKQKKEKKKAVQKKMKRPAAATGDDEKEKKESLLAKTEKWKQVGTKGTKQISSSGSSDGDDENDTEQEKRQRGKSKKFKKMADAGAIPDHIWEMFSKEAAKHPKPRQFKTQLINKLFKEDGSGGYIMCAEDPWFQQQKEIFHKRYGKDEQQGTPKDVFLYQVFHGNKDALEQAIQNGSVQQWQQDGVPFCGYRKTKAGIENAGQDTTKIGAKEVKLDGSQYQALSKAFKTLSWSFGDQQLCDGGTGGGAPSSSSGQRRAVEDVGLTKEMITTLQDAKNAQEKLHATAMKLLNKCSSVADQQEFKATVKALKDWSQKNEYVLAWKRELPDETPLTPTNFRAFITDQAEPTRKLNEEVEKFKALLKTRGEF